MADEQRDPSLIPLSDLFAGCGGISRRVFCAGAGAGLIALGLPACGQGGGVDDGGTADLGGGTPDLTGGGGSCATGGVNAGPVSAIALNSAKHLTDNQSYDLFVCHDGGGLYALSAVCTHAGCTVRRSSSGFACPCHGATFDFNGQHPTSPAGSPLDHYALCVDGSGNVIVDYNTVVAPSTRV